jgi:hypothetical protein
MNQTGTFQKIQREISHPEILNLSCVLASRERFHNLFNRDRRVGPVNLVKRDTVHAQSPQASLESPEHTLAAQVAAHLTRGIPSQAALGGDHHIAASLAQGFCEHLFSSAKTIDVGDIEKIHTLVNRKANRGTPFGFVHRAVVVSARGAAPETDAGDNDRCLTKSLIFHLVPRYHTK